MLVQHSQNKRRGSVLPLVAMCTVAIMGMVALAIDVGMVAIARNQCQNAADSAAMAGARTITGDSSTSYNVANAPTNAVVAATANSVFGTRVVGDSTTNWNPTDPATLAKVHPSTDTFVTGDVTINVGSYAYIYNDSSPSSEGFQIQFPRASTSEPYSAVKATIAYSGDFAFGRVFGLSKFNSQAFATAVHRPRDVVIIMDLSGSMRFQSLPAIPYTGARTTSMQADVYPKFGHYSNTASAALYGNSSIPTGAGEYYDPTNLTIANNSGSAIVDDFHQNNSTTAPSSSNLAFTRWSDSYDVTPGGDNYPAKFGTSTTPITYAQTVNDWKNFASVRNAAFESTASTGGYGSSFNGYTQGPGYWGKTFYLWPPDPRGATSTDMSVAANQASNGAKDWRQRFFIKVNTGTSAMSPCDDNTLLWNSSGQFLAPHTSVTINEIDPSTRKGTVNYLCRINYAAIFSWLRANPQPFPYILRAGRIRYYDSMPDPATDTGINDRLWKNQNGTTDNERFWRNYIDFVLGVKVNGSSGGYVTYSNTNGSTRYAQMIGNGDVYTWGTQQIKQKPNETTQTDYITGGSLNSSPSKGATTLALTGVGTTPTAGDIVVVTTSGTKYYYTVGASPTKSSITISPGLAVAGSSGNTVTFRHPGPYMYMDYADNSPRPKHHYWFGAQTMLDYLGNYNTSTFLWPGNCHEAQAWACKAGIQSAIDDIKSNHPSDFVGLCYFSSPCYSSGGSGQYNTPVVPLGRNYDNLKASLWFPPSTINAGATEIGMYDADMNNVPRANGSTSPAMGFMLAYNLLSSSYTSLRNYPQPQSSYRGVIGGLGRKGAARLVIFETDGAPNTGSSATLSGTGSDSYYAIRLYNPGNYTDGNNTQWPSNPAYAASGTYSIVQQICALDTASPPGFSTKRKPVKVYALGYGSLFDTANSGATQQTALTFLQTIQYYGGTSTDTTYSNFPSNQRIYGANDTSVGGRIDRMQKAFSAIMQAGVQVSLIQ